jgi:glucose/arabinose dehydrogenase
LDNPPKPEVVYDGYPSDKHHGWKYLRVGPDGKLYVPVGAPCNICLSDNEIYATLTRLDVDGKHREIFARGIRNTVGFDWHPQTGELWFTDNGRDLLGDDVPPEELNHAPKAGMHFGYPYCHAGSIADPEYGGRRPCKDFTPPAWQFPAHVAPLGVHFYRGQSYPEAYRGQLFVAQHGSWNRTQPQGYRIVVVRFSNGQPVSDEVFAEGWLQPNGQVLGRPVDILELADGSLLVSDDRRGVIYRITHQP